jgi:hypothetical protein
MKRGEVSVCLQSGNRPPCKHWEPDYIGFKCHGYNKIMQKCTGYEPGTPNTDFNLTQPVASQVKS